MKFTIIYLVWCISVSVVWTDRPNICTGSDNGALIRNTNDCGAYYTCVDSVPIGSLCPPGKLFNDFTKKCDEPDHVECFTCPQSILKDLPVPNECNQFIRCNKNVSTQLTCSDGLLYDTNIDHCNVASRVNCIFTVICPKYQEYAIFILDRDSCNK